MPENLVDMLDVGQFVCLAIEQTLLCSDVGDAPHVQAGLHAARSTWLGGIAIITCRTTSGSFSLRAISRALRNALLARAL